jgi:hypothetical protein
VTKTDFLSASPRNGEISPFRTETSASFLAARQETPNLQLNPERHSQGQRSHAGSLAFTCANPKLKAPGYDDHSLWRGQLAVCEPNRLDREIRALPMAAQAALRTRFVGKLPSSLDLFATVGRFGP